MKPAFKHQLAGKLIVRLIFALALLASGVSKVQAMPAPSRPASDPGPVSAETVSTPPHLYLPSLLNKSYFCNPLAYRSEPYYLSAAVYQWGFDMIHASQPFSACLEGDPNLIVAVVDSGVNLTHPDLVDRVLPGAYYLHTNNLPNNLCKTTLDAKDNNGHGTHVSGIIAASLNGVGVFGVAPNVKILPVKVLDCSGSGYTSDIANGIIWAVDHGANIINLSLGGPASTDDVKSAIDYAIGKGVVVIAAAGNHTDPYGKDNYISYPASYPNVLSVAAVDYQGHVTYFSNYNSYVDIAAPGANIFSSYITITTNSQASECNMPIGSNYCWLSGTSMASPYVAGTAALIRSAHPEYTVSQVINVIEQTALDEYTPGRDDYYGYGIIQANLALSTAPSVTAADADLPNLQAQSLPADQRDAPIASGTILVRFKSGADQIQIEQALGSLGLQRSGVSFNGFSEKITVSAGQEWQTIDALRNLPMVETAEPDYLVQAQ